MHARTYLVGVVFAGLLGVVSPSAVWASSGGGSLDPTFGNGGKVVTNFGGIDWAAAVAVQRDGKIVAAGRSGGTGLYDFALARYNRGGRLDRTFGTAGKVVTDFGGGAVDSSSAEAVAVQPDGKIVAVGFHSVGGRFESFDFAMARYHRDGRLDATFGTGGMVLTDVSGAGSHDEAYAVAIQPNGQIVVAGHSNAGGDTDFALARYNRDGSLDPTFDSDGKVLTNFSDFGSADVADAVVIEPNGRIIAAGSSFEHRRTDFALARYNRDGSLDPTFDGDGKVLTAFTSYFNNTAASAVALQTDGKIVAAGFSNVRGRFEFALVRYDQDGSLDPTFGAGGKVLTSFGGATDLASAVAVQRDGKIVAAGQTDFRGTPTDFALARYNRDGSLDSTFGTGGAVVTDFSGTGSSSDRAYAVAVQPDSKIVAAGSSDVGGGLDFALARYRA